MYLNKYFLNNIQKKFFIDKNFNINKKIKLLGK